MDRDMWIWMNGPTCSRFAQRQGRAKDIGLQRFGGGVFTQVFRIELVDLNALRAQQTGIGLRQQRSLAQPPSFENNGLRQLPSGRALCFLRGELHRSVSLLANVLVYGRAAVQAPFAQNPANSAVDAGVQHAKVLVDLFS